MDPNTKADDRLSRGQHSERASHAPSVTRTASDSQSHPSSDQHADYFEYTRTVVEQADNFFQRVRGKSSWTSPPEAYLGLFRATNASAVPPNTFDKFTGPLIRGTQGNQHLNQTFALENHKDLSFGASVLAQDPDIRAFSGEESRIQKQKIKDILKLSEAVGRGTPRCVSDAFSTQDPQPELASFSGYWIAGKFFITCAHAVTDGTLMVKAKTEWRTAIGAYVIEATINNTVRPKKPESSDTTCEVKLVELFLNDDVAIYMLLPNSAGPRKTLPLDFLGWMSNPKDTKIFALGYPAQDWFLKEKEQQDFARRNPRVRDYIQARISAGTVVTQSQAMLCESAVNSGEASTLEYFDEELAFKFAYEDVFHFNIKSLAVGSVCGSTSYPYSDDTRPSFTHMIKTDMSLFYGFSGGMVGYFETTPRGENIIVCGIVHGVDPRDGTKNACTIFTRRGCKLLKNTIRQLADST